MKKIKENKKVQKIFLLACIMIIFMQLISFANNNDLVTEDLRINFTSGSDDKVIYGCAIGEGIEQESISFSAKDFNLPPNLFTYNDKIRLRLTYLKSDKTVKDCKIINFLTNTIIEDTSEENIEKLFNVEYGKTKIEKDWVEKIKLSELKENEIYQYTAKVNESNFPEIENDLEKNCITYIKKGSMETFGYKEEIMMNRNIDGTAVSFSFNQYDADEYFCFMYKTVNNEELLKLIKDETIYLSNYKDGDKLEYNTEEYIYNDTENDITINITDLTFDIESKDTFVIKKDEICGFDWMINTATISYSGAVTNLNNENKANQAGTPKNEVTTSNTPSNKIISSNVNKTTNKVTNETIQEIPDTGVEDFPIFIMMIVTIFSIIRFKRYYDFSEDMKLK